MQSSALRSWLDAAEDIWSLLDSLSFGLVVPDPAKPISSRGRRIHSLPNQICRQQPSSSSLCCQSLSRLFVSGIKNILFMSASSSTYQRSTALPPPAAACTNKVIGPALQCRAGHSNKDSQRPASHYNCPARGMRINPADM